MRILVLGSSHIGALARGWKNIQDKYPGYNFDFIGSAGQKFRKAKINKGSIASVPFSTGGGRDLLSKFDAFIVVADFPPLRTTYMRQLELTQYSHQVRQAVLFETYRASISYFALKQLIRPLSDAPVYILSTPEKRDLPLVFTETEYHKTLKSVETIIQSDNVFYVPQPRKTLDDNLKPRDKFYTDAVNIHGQIANHQMKSSLGHLNRLGGEIILSEIIGRINSV